MTITEVRVKLAPEASERVLAYCTIVLDGCFAVSDLKIIDGNSGIFVAMPSRKLTDNCPRCRTKNHLLASYCNRCGQRLNSERTCGLSEGKLHADVAHPINRETREMLQRIVVQAYHDEIERSKQPNYVCNYDQWNKVANERQIEQRI